MALALLSIAIAGCLVPSSGPDEGTSPDSATSTTHATDAATSGPMSTNSSTGAPADTGITTDDGPATIGIEVGGPPPEYCPPGVEPPTIELGHGVDEYLPLDSGPAQIYLGHQGGYHVTLGMRGVGLDLADFGDGHLRGTVAEQVVADLPTLVVMDCDPSGEFSEALWINMIFDVDPMPLLGQTALVEAEYVDASGRVVTTTAEVLLSETIVPL